MDHLPNEILIKILEYLDTYDLVQFCAAFQHLDYFLKEKNLIRITDWSRRFEIHDTNICSFISIKMDPTRIKVLKINCLYWIPAQDLRRLLQKLINLTELYAIDTKLGLKYQDVIEYSKLSKLAISVEDENLGSETIVAGESLKSLTKLCIKIVSKKEYVWDALSGLDLFLSNIKQLNEVWVLDDVESLYRVNYERLVIELVNLKKLVIRSRSVLPVLDFKFAGFSKTFQCKMWNTNTELIFEKVLDQKERTVKSIFDPTENDLIKAWNIFQGLHSDLPCGPKESKLLNDREKVSNIQFESLNFSNSIIFCNSLYVNAAQKLLESDNCKQLQKLNFRTCFLQGFEEINKQKENNCVVFKKARVGVKKDVLNHPFEKVCQHLKNLVELEIYYCARCTGSFVVSGYPLLKHFEKLQRLTLEIPYLVDGSFLEKVFRSCRRLEHLSLKLTAPNEPFVTNLYMYLEHAVALKHFRIQCSTISIEKILKGLSKISKKILQRIFIKCDHLNYSNNKDVRQFFSEFLESNPQLVFFGLVASQATAKQITDIQRTLFTFKRGHPTKIFYVKKVFRDFTANFPVPPAHHDIVFNHYRVSVIDVDEF